MVKIMDYFSNDPSVKVIKDSTISFLNSLPDECLDMVYIDADHSYNSVLEDLRLSYHKIKTGGFICGHDYIHDAKNAVDDFCREKNLEIEYLTKDGCPSFCIVKK
jgi:predicted O-methyltransferase YrrM